MIVLLSKGIKRLPRPGTVLGAILFLVSLSFVGCHTVAATSAVVTTPTPTVSAPVVPVKSVGTSSPLLSSAKGTPDFDETWAFASLKKQCDFGPRPLGSEAHDKIRSYLLNEMKACADETITQEFSYRGMKVTNIIGVFYPAGKKTPSKDPVLLLAHWDTRPIADGPESSEASRGFHYGPQGWNRTTPIMGANDGASGTAILLEVARLLKQTHPPSGVVLLLDDGEDYGDFRANDNEGDGVELGSRYFAKHFQDDPRFGHPSYGILLDMVGAKNMVLPRETLSDQYAFEINRKVFAVADKLNYSNVFRYKDTQSVNDDHWALNKAGIPTIDLIHPLPGGNDNDNSYTYWHTLEDTVDKCSPKSLKIVGQTVTEVLFEESPEP